MNDPAHARGNALLSFLLVFIVICFGIVIMMLGDGMFEADLEAHPEVKRGPDGRNGFALVVVLLDPSGSMGKPENLKKAKYLVNEKLIPKCGAGDECVAYFVNDLFTARNQIFPGIECQANAQEASSRFPCPDLPILEDKQAALVLDLLSKLPKHSPGIRLGEKEQTLINKMRLLREQEKASHQDWTRRVSAMKSPLPKNDRSDICGALEAIGNRFKHSTYREKWFIAVSDLKDDVRVKANGKPRANGESSPCSSELGNGFEDVKTVVIVPFEQIKSSAEFESKWSNFFPSPIAVHALSTVSDNDLLAKNPTMGLEEFTRETKWTIFFRDTPNWLGAAGAGLLVAILWLWSRLNESSQPHSPSDAGG